MPKVRLIRPLQGPITAVTRPGDPVIPNRRAGRWPPPAPPPGFAQITTFTGESGDGQARGFDAAPEAFGAVDPETVESITITEGSVDNTGLVIFELEEGAQFTTPFVGINAYVSGVTPDHFFRQIAMEWNPTTARYESVNLHPDLFAALGALTEA